MASKVYFPDDGTIQVHLSRVCGCPKEFPGGFYWYGGRRAGPGRPPRWLDSLDLKTPSSGTDSGMTQESMQDEPTDSQDDPQGESQGPWVSTPAVRTRTRVITPPERLMELRCDARDELA